MGDEIARLKEEKMKKEIEIEGLKKELVALKAAMENKRCARRKRLEELEQSLHAEIE
ncbi:hypothetical protein A2U01_0081707, partial [Trifolium medium]|nr:hypothetical protein [Trifolium medium]